MEKGQGVGEEVRGSRSAAANKQNVNVDCDCDCNDDDDDDDIVASDFQLFFIFCSNKSRREQKTSRQGGGEGEGGGCNKSGLCDCTVVHISLLLSARRRA